MRFFLAAALIALFSAPTMVLAADLDMDGYESADDCDDTNPDVYPGAPEYCDGLDNSCDGLIPAEELDADGDGYASCEGDCDDDDGARFPTAIEVCDGLDNDCDGDIPDDEDTDGDFDGTLLCADCDDSSSSLNQLDQDEDGWTTCDVPADCADLGRPESHPGAEEICDGLDNDCNGEVPVDEQDEDADGTSLCEGDCDDADADRTPANSEEADVNCEDGIDNDCNGLIDSDDDNCIPENEPPEVGFGAATQVRYVVGPQTLIFDATESTDTELVPLTYEWRLIGPDGDYQDATAGELVWDAATGYAALPVQVSGHSGETVWSFTVEVTITDEDADSPWDNWSTVGPIQLQGVLFRPEGYLSPSVTGCSVASAERSSQALGWLALALPLLIWRRRRSQEDA
jgi:hypothetical protein